MKHCVSLNKGIIQIYLKKQKISENLPLVGTEFVIVLNGIGELSYQVTTVKTVALNAVICFYLVKHQLSKSR